jgi:hypothetical protein
MSENRLKEKDTEAAEVEEVRQPERRRKSRSSRNFVRLVNIFGWFDRDQLARNMPFILYVTFLVLCYIANSYYSESIIRDIDKTKAELKEKSSEFIILRSELMYSSKQSEVATAVSAYQLHESMEPPKKLIQSSNPESAR